MASIGRSQSRHCGLAARRKCEANRFCWLALEKFDLQLFYLGGLRGSSREGQYSVTSLVEPNRKMVEEEMEKHEVLFHYKISRTNFTH